MLEEEYESRRVLPLHLRKPVEPELPFSFSIREARLEDLPSVQEIYNYYVANSTVTFDERAMTLVDWRRKFELLHRFNMPFVVAESPTGQLLGYALAAPIRATRMGRSVAENSIYLGPAATGKGLGKPLLGALIEQARARKIRELIAIIADHNAEGSIRLHQSFGFVESGRMANVGYKFGRSLGTVMMQKSLRKS